MNEFGIVETINFEKKFVNLKELEDANALPFVSKDL